MTSELHARYTSALIVGSDVWIFDVVLISIASMGSVVIDAHQVLMTVTW